MSAAALPANAATQRMLRGPVLPTLLRLATPNVLGLFANTVVIGFDGYIVGRLGADTLAGVAVVLPLAMLMLQMSAGGLGGSTTAVVARALGAGDAPQATRLAQHALLLGLVASLLFTLVAASPALYAAMGARDAVLAQASRYAAVLFSGAAAIWCVNVLAGVARGTGDMAAAALALVATTVMHLLLCPVLVFGAGAWPGLGVAGAATSTVTCNALSALGLLAWLSRRGRQVRIVGTRWELRRDSFRTILKLALPSALSPVLSNSSIALATAYVGTFGSLAVAAYGIAARLEYILVPIAFGIGGALTAMVATNLGAQQAVRAKRVAWTGASLVWAVTGLIGLAAAMWPQAWMALFSADAAVREAGSTYLRIVGGSYGFFGLGLALFFASQGAGRLAWPLTASTARLLVMAAGGWLAIRLAPGSPGVLYAVVALSLVVMGTTLATATHFAQWGGARGTGGTSPR
ncbi:MATE family efflux transporter [Ramlibacter sp. USB13]|uniref:MATE family efflux transporter n=1 Tax=Ramlibacter cellulosilyticus TaxID=2764187 RepID=A0A923SD86_9BURK|nr:MATE family efflux transporter [Ramlibacter cellulosilyticus]MBC5785771.1 MATE family efflux transporter [Ramlibacter cellulosilyticus]